jgi:hypothetical protein
LHRLQELDRATTIVAIPHDAVDQHPSHRYLDFERQRFRRRARDGQARLEQRLLFAPPAIHLEVVGKRQEPTQVGLDMRRPAARQLACGRRSRRARGDRPGAAGDQREEHELTNRHCSLGYGVTHLHRPRVALTG